VVLTIVDPDLVYLVKHMHYMYENFGNGTYSTRKIEESMHLAADYNRNTKVGEYNLYFQKKNSNNY
jgi:hypothetical protein